MSGSVVDNAATVAAVRGFGFNPIIKPEEAVDVFTKWQDLSNKQATQKQIQATTANLELTNETGQQTLAAKRASDLGKLAFAQSLNPNITAADAKTALYNYALTNPGVIPPGSIDAIAKQLDATPPGQLRDKLREFGASSLSPDQQQKIQIEYKNHPINVTGAGGGSVITAGPSGEDAISSNQAVQPVPLGSIQNVPDAAYRAGQGPVSTMPSYTALGGSPQTGGVTMPPPGGGTYPVPQTPGVGTGRLQANPGSNGTSPDDGVSPPMAANNPNMTRDPRLNTRMNEASAVYTKDKLNLPNLRNEEQTILSAQSDLNNPDVITGPGSKFATSVRGLITTYNSALGKDPNNIDVANAAQADLEKNLTRLYANNPLAAHSVAAMIAQEHGNMNTLMPKLTNQHLGLTLVGQKRQEILSLLAEGKMPNSGNQYDTTQQWVSGLDPIALGANTNPEAAAAYKKSISGNKQQLANYNRSVVVAQKYGLYDRMPPVNPYGQ